MSQPEATSRIHSAMFPNSGGSPNQGKGAVMQGCQRPGRMRAMRFSFGHLPLEIQDNGSVVTIRAMAP